MNSGLHHSLDADEVAALQKMDDELRRPLAILQRAFNALGRAAALNEPIRPMSQARKVSMVLMHRLSNEIRCAALLAARGYPLQAAALVATAFEVAYAIAVIGNDEAVAQEWIDHGDPTRAFRPARRLVSEVLKTKGLMDDKTESQLYRHYQQLCLAKHANPLLEKQLAFQAEPTGATAINGPNTSEPAVRVAWFALTQAVGYAFLALGIFCEQHVADEEERSHVEHEAKVLWLAYRELTEKAIARWGQEDPFAGRWTKRKRDGTVVKKAVSNTGKLERHMK